MARAYRYKSKRRTTRNPENRRRHPLSKKRPHSRQYASQHEIVDRLGSVCLSLVRLFGNSYGRVPNKTQQPWRGRTCRGARQILFCTKTLHQPYNKAEVW